MFFRVMVDKLTDFSIFITMINLFKRTRISILDKNWKPIKQKLKLKMVPTYDELIWVADAQQYYKVLNVIHSIHSNGQHIFIIVDKYIEKGPKNEGL